MIIEDNGTEIPSELEERIFETFFTTKATGTGLGLSIAGEILSRYGGNLVYRRGEARTKQFLVKLPFLNSKG
ncbi:ATP-binding protein [Gloeothece verrucosa]|uniref:ATP-binding protein n=1 Tax=Gloeothece verrucosa TaxID=2546359 RepID=UPI00030BE4A2